MTYKFDPVQVKPVSTQAQKERHQFLEIVTGEDSQDYIPLREIKQLTIRKKNVYVEWSNESASFHNVTNIDEIVQKMNAAHLS